MKFTQAELEAAYEQMRQQRLSDVELSRKASEWLAPFFSNLNVAINFNSYACLDVTPERKRPDIVVSHCEYDRAHEQVETLIQKHPDKVKKLAEQPTGYFRGCGLGINAHSLDLSGVPGFPLDAQFKIVFSGYDSHGGGY